MNIILGASGQVGSALAKKLIEKDEPVRAVIRDKQKTGDLESKGIEVRIADYFDEEALTNAVQGGDLIFLLTPETEKSEDVLGDTKTLLRNYRSAIESSQIKKVVGLSSIGAQHAGGTGNLQMSYMLEHTFDEMFVQQIFVRPAYYYSNWLGYLSTVRNEGVLPTFFPPDLKIPMAPPIDVAKYIADIITGDTEKSQIYELTGPEAYSSVDVAHVLGEILDCKVEAQQIPKNRWEETLQQIDFTEDVTKNLIKMTEAVIDGRARPERQGTNLVELPTTLKQYLRENLKPNR